MSIQATFRTTDVLMDEVNKLVKMGVYRSKTEVFNEALRGIIQRYRAQRAYEQILKIRERNKDIPADLTELVVKAHEEEDKKFSRK